MTYRVESGKLTVPARSKVHERATVTVDLASFDAGDSLAFDMDAPPKATFELRGVKQAVAVSVRGAVLA